MLVLIMLAVIWGGGLVVPGVCPAVPPPDEVLVQQAVQNLAQENYEEALEQLNQAWRMGPKTAEKAALLGKVNRSLLRYPEAVTYLEEALRLKPDFSEAQLLLADTLIALGQVDQAIPHLEQLQARGFEPAQTAFRLGQVFSKKEEYAKAAEYFRQAEDDPALAQEAKFQRGLALAAADRLAEARRSIEDAITLDPKSQLSVFAQGYMVELDRRIKETKPFRFYLTTGFDYDSNVTLNPGGVSGQQISGQGDLVYTQTATFEYNFLPRGPLALWASYAYYQNFHRRITTYDLLTHTVGLTPTYTWSKGRFWLPFTYNYTDVGSDKYYTAFVLLPSYLHLLTPKVGLEVGMRWDRHYYWYPLPPYPQFPIPLPQENRSGQNLGGNVALYYFLKKQQGFLMARFTYLHDFTDGSNWENSSYFLNFTAYYPVTDRFKVRGFLELGLQPFNYRWTNGIQTFPNRYDRFLILGVELTQNIYKGLEISGHYYFVRDNSNNALYDYYRHIWGGFLAYRY